MLSLKATMILSAAMLWLGGCTLGRLMGPLKAPPPNIDCVTEQVMLYDDLCAESTTAYEIMSGTEAHFEGVRCAVEAIKLCQEDQ